MEMNLKSRIESISSSLYMIVMLCLICECKTATPRPTHAEKKIDVSVLRLTYDSTWSPKSRFVILESGSIHANGNTYTIEYLEASVQIPWLKISSTDQDNKQNFKYVPTISGEDYTVFYRPWLDKTIGMVLAPSQTEKNIVHCRWEGVYKGFLIVVEAKFQNTENFNLNEIANIYHKHVKESLTLY
jgi:hypothetical protein